MSFKIFETRFISPDEDRKVSGTFTGSFELTHYSVIFEGTYISLIWNPIYKQPQFMIQDGFNSTLLSGGFKLKNDAENLLKVFQYNCVHKDEPYFFSGDKSEEVGEAEICYNIVDETYNFKEKWNRAELWLSSGANSQRLPYHEITLVTDLFKGHFRVEVH